MTTHPPHHPAHPSTPDPDSTDGAAASDGDVRPLVDLVAGDPPVPITVWRTARASGDSRGSIPARLARRLVAAYSRPGEAVVDVTDDHALTTACQAGRRRHHPAWFTEDAALVIGPTTAVGAADTGGVDVDDETDTDLPPRHHGAGPGRATRAGDDADRGEPAVPLDAWFGDDLTDAGLPPTAAPVVPVPDGVPLTGRISLVVATWPLDEQPVSNRVRLAWLLAACRDLLRPGGCLVLVVAVPPGHPAAGRGVTPEDFSPIVAAAARAGLGYLQHIVAVAADLSGDGGDVFVYHLDDEELLTLSRVRAYSEDRTWTVAHLRVHADLLVFTPSQIPARTGRGGEDRG